MSTHVQTCPLSSYNIVLFDNRLCAQEGWRHQGIFCHGLFVAVGQVVFRTTRWHYCGSSPHFESSVCHRSTWFKPNKQDTAGRSMLWGSWWRMLANGPSAGGMQHAGAGGTRGGLSGRGEASTRGDSPTSGANPGVGSQQPGVSPQPYSFTGSTGIRGRFPEGGPKEPARPRKHLQDLLRHNYLQKEKMNLFAWWGNCL